jgi:hypothetical protein
MLVLLLMAMESKVVVVMGLTVVLIAMVIMRNELYVDGIHGEKRG